MENDQIAAAVILALGVILIVFGLIKSHAADYPDCPNCGSGGVEVANQTAARREFRCTACTHRWFQK